MRCEGWPADQEEEAGMGIQASERGLTRRNKRPTDENKKSRGKGWMSGSRIAQEDLPVEKGVST